MSTGELMKALLREYTSNSGASLSLRSFSAWCLNVIAKRQAESVIAIWELLSCLCIKLKAEAPYLDHGARNMVGQLYEVMLTVRPGIERLEHAVTETEKRSSDELVRRSLSALTTSLGEFAHKAGDWSDFESWVHETIGDTQGPGDSCAEGRHCDVFICHASADKKVVRQLVNRLRENGVSVWFDENEIRLGDPISERIESGLKSAKWIVVCLSPSLGRSNWCRREYGPIIHREIQSKNVSVIPVEVVKTIEKDIPKLLYDKLRVTDPADPVQFAALVDRVISHRQHAHTVAGRR